MDNNGINKKTYKINSDVLESIRKSNKHIELISKGFVGSPSFQKAIEQAQLTSKITRGFVNGPAFSNLMQQQKALSEALKINVTNINPALTSQITKGLLDSPAFSNMTQQQKALSEALKINVPNISSAFTSQMTELASMSKMLGAYITQQSAMMQGIIKGLTSNLADIFEKVKITLPQLTQQEIEEREKAMKDWGKYGWAMILNASPSFFYTTFNTQKEADAYAIKFFDKKETGLLFKHIVSDTKHKMLCDLAIDSFKNRKYHASAMITLSIIDRIMSENFWDDKYSRKAIGILAVKKYEKQFCAKKGEGLFIGYMLETNLRCVLYNLYNDTEDFKKHKYTMNRHNLIHGWQIKKVTRTDCIKMFLTLCNLQFILKK